MPEFCDSLLSFTASNVQLLTGHWLSQNRMVSYLLGSIPKFSPKRLGYVFKTEMNLSIKRIPAH